MPESALKKCGLLSAPDWKSLGSMYLPKLTTLAISCGFFHTDAVLLCAVPSESDEEGNTKSRKSKSFNFFCRSLSV